MNEFREVWAVAGKDSVLAAVVIIALLKGIPFLQWVLQTYAPPRREIATTGEEAPVTTIIKQLMERLDRLAEAVLQLATTAAKQNETANHNHAEMMRAFENHDERAQRIEGSVTRIEAKM